MVRGLVLAVATLAGCTSPPPPVTSVAAPAEIATTGRCAALYRAEPTYSQNVIAERVAAAKAEFADETAYTSRPKPKALQPAGPSYPYCALIYGITEARCDVVLDVSAEGLPEEIIPVCTHAMFEDDAMMAARKWRFEPAMQDGVAVATKTLVAPIIFLTEEHQASAD